MLANSNHINLVFHNVVSSQDDVKDEYTVTEQELIHFLELGDTLMQDFYIKTCVFFDDGYTGIVPVIPVLHKLGIRTKVAIITNNIGQPGYLTKELIQELDSSGTEVCSHGTSHAALALDFDSNVPGGGQYEDVPRGRGKVLSRNEIEYQLKESEKRLREIGVSTSSFVYPYGLFNQDMLEIIEADGTYQNGYSCDFVFPPKNAISLLALPRLLHSRKNNFDFYVDSLRAFDKYS